MLEGEVDLSAADTKEAVQDALKDGTILVK